MSIIVSDKIEHSIKVTIRYVDKGTRGVLIFNDKDEELDWINNQKVILESKKIQSNDSVEEINPESKIQELNTWWKRMDWGSQAKIFEESKKPNSEDVDVVAFRFAQMKYLMIDWDFKNNKGEKVPLDERIFSRLDFNVGIHIVNKYEEKLAENDIDGDEIENLG
jgi:hypothetical protein